jgi:hypothetical protein
LQPLAIIADVRRSRGVRPRASTSGSSLRESESPAHHEPREPKAGVRW